MQVKLLTHVFVLSISRPEYKKQLEWQCACHSLGTSHTGLHAVLPVLSSMLPFMLDARSPGAKGEL